MARAVRVGVRDFCAPPDESGELLRLLVRSHAALMAERRQHFIHDDPIVAAIDAKSTDPMANS